MQVHVGPSSTRPCSTNSLPKHQGDQDGHFFSNYPERGGATPLPRRAQPLLLLFRSDPLTEGGEINTPQQPGER